MARLSRCQGDQSATPDGAATSRDEAGEAVRDAADVGDHFAPQAGGASGGKSRSIESATPP